MATFGIHLAVLLLEADHAEMTILAHKYTPSSSVGKKVILTEVTDVSAAP